MKRVVNSSRPWPPESVYAPNRTKVTPLLAKLRTAAVNAKEEAKLIPSASKGQSGKPSTVLVNSQTSRRSLGSPTTRKNQGDTKTHLLTSQWVPDSQREKKRFGK